MINSRLSIAVALISTVTIFAADGERASIRREMIEMDIAVRNFASAISIGDRKVLDEIFGRLTSWQMKDHPEFGQSFRQVLSKWEAKNAIRFGRQIQTEAKALRGYASSRAKFSDTEWSRMRDGLGKILTGCAGCHNTIMKDKK
jgi:hypothetical protein